MQTSNNSDDNTEGSFLFTSESVGDGHPDKLCDQISDAILDAFLRKDPEAKVACECFIKSNMVYIGGEISSTASVDLQTVVRCLLQEVGYDSCRKGMDYRTCEIMTLIEQQSDDIAQGVHQGRRKEDIGAGDQGIMFGYATDETEQCMPLTLVLAHEMCRQLGRKRRDGTLQWAGPDCKAQVTVEYVKEDGACRPIRVHTLVISAQHDEHTSLAQVRNDLMEHVVRRGIPAHLLDQRTIYHLNPAGRFVIGGPAGDAGLTGRKIIVDTYGGWGAHGGGAFSGKDYSKVDRSAAYAARWVAKSLVKAGLCRRVLIELSYAIGISEPLAIYVNSYGTGKVSDSELLRIVRTNFDLRPGVIVDDLQLREPLYLKTAVYGHFGRPEFPWEQCRRLQM